MEAYLSSFFANSINGLNDSISRNVGGGKLGTRCGLDFATTHTNPADMFCVDRTVLLSQARRLFGFCLLTAACSSCSIAGQSPGEDIAELSLNELANTQVTSVARKPQTLSKAAAAVFVITRDDIRRSGAVSLPEVLRLAPGVQVARINQSEWAVSVRGLRMGAGLTSCWF